MSVEAYIRYRLPTGSTWESRTTGGTLRFECSTEAEMEAITNLIDGDTGYTQDSGKRWRRQSGAWTIQTTDSLASALQEESGPTVLQIGVIADGQFLKRVGADVVGAAGGGGAAWGDITGTLSTQSDLQAALDAKGTSNFSGAYADLTGKPTLGTAAATASADYATAAQGATANTALQPAGNGSSLTGLTKTQVGLASADNTADADKPVSAAAQTALDLKAPLASPTFTGTVTLPTQFTVGAVSVLTTGTELNFVDGVTSAIQTQLDAKQATLVSGTTIKTVNGSSLLGSGNLAVSASDPVYAPGTFTVATGTGRLFIALLELVGADILTIEGNSTLRLV